MDLNDAKNLLEEICKEYQANDADLMHGIAGEKKHAYDILNWVEKLNPEPALSLSIAALFHDIERIAIEGAGSGSFRGTPEEYRAYKKNHARNSAEYIYPILVVKGLPQADAETVRFLITHHDDTREELEVYQNDDLETLVAADSLSFFDSFGMKMYEDRGRDIVKQKIRFMALKMFPKYRKILVGLDVGTPLLNEVKNEVMQEIGEV